MSTGLSWKARACNEWLEKRDARKSSRMDLVLQKAKKKLHVKGFVAIKKGTPLYEHGRNTLSRLTLQLSNGRGAVFKTLY